MLPEQFSNKISITEWVLNFLYTYGTFKLLLPEQWA
jgi:hypothetical protein